MKTHAPVRGSGKSPVAASAAKDRFTSPQRVVPTVRPAVPPGALHDYAKMELPSGRTFPAGEQARAIPNRTGLPDRLKAGVEHLSDLAMDDVRVHDHSSKPATVHAHAYARGTDIHLGPGQEKYLAHEEWHVAQQKQGRVKPALQMKGVAINDDGGLGLEADAAGSSAEKLTIESGGGAPLPGPQMINGSRGPVVQRMLRIEAGDGAGEYTKANIKLLLDKIGESMTHGRTGQRGVVHFVHDEKRTFSFFDMKDAVEYVADRTKPEPQEIEAADSPRFKSKNSKSGPNSRTNNASALTTASPEGEQPKTREESAFKEAMDSSSAIMLSAENANAEAHLDRQQSKHQPTIFPAEEKQAAADVALTPDQEETRRQNSNYNIGGVRSDEGYEPGRVKGGGGRFSYPNASEAWHKKTTLPAMLEWAEELKEMKEGEKKHIRSNEYKNDGIIYNGMCLMFEGRKYVFFHCYPNAKAKKLLQ
jgi:hypothetical protein